MFWTRAHCLFWLVTYWQTWLELSRVKLYYRKWPEGKQKLLRVGGRFEFLRVWVAEGKTTVNVWQTGLSLRAVTHSTCYGWVHICLIFPWCYGWNCLLLIWFTDKVTNLLWVWRIRLQVTKNLMKALMEIQGKSILVWVSVRFNLTRVWVIGSRPYCHIKLRRSV